MKNVINYTEVDGQIVELTTDSFDHALSAARHISKSIDSLCVSVTNETVFILYERGRQKDMKVGKFKV